MEAYLDDRRGRHRQPSTNDAPNERLIIMDSKPKPSAPIGAIMMQPRRMGKSLHLATTLAAASAHNLHICASDHAKPSIPIQPIQMIRRVFNGGGRRYRRADCRKCGQKNVRAAREHGIPLCATCMKSLADYIETHPIIEIDPT